MSHHDRRMTAAKIAQRLALIAPLVYRQRAPLDTLWLKAAETPDMPTADTFSEALHDWQILAPGQYWGHSNLNFFMRSGFRVPSHFDPAQPTALFLPLGDAGDFSHPEALVYIDGEPYATIDRHHQEILLPAAYCGGENHALLLHGWTGLLGGMEYAPHVQLMLHECALVQIDPPTRAFIALARTALQTSTLLDDHHPAKAYLLNALDDAFRVLDTREPLADPFYQTVPDALAALQAGIGMAGPALDIDVVAAGHAHIDVAWLWTLAQTRRKAGRTFHTVLRLMEQFPQYHFTQSQPQLYAYAAEDYPELFAAIRQRVAEGRWELIGGMWVEADCNISGSESLARQFLLGRSYFREHFGSGTESPVLWLPDVFGYAWNLPQLIRLAGLEYFFTIKIGWNQVNRMPYDSFWWQGLDGTKVLTHFSTTPDHPWQGGELTRANLMSNATYNAKLDAFAVLGTWSKSQHKEAQRVFLMSYGYGDGGGGPTREMNENAGLLRDFPAQPRVRQGRVIDFFRRLERESGHALPTWNSELYLEIHRGTYTTQSRNKWANRRSEFLLHDAEFLAALASLHSPNTPYPHADLLKAWELVCLNQFHDIIPGSSIGAVYSDSLSQYATVRQITETIQRDALGTLAERTGGDVLLVNPTSFTRSDLVFWPGDIPAGQTLETSTGQQQVAGGMLFAFDSLPPYSVTGLRWASSTAQAVPALVAEPRLLENAYLRVEFDDAGDIIRLYDKQHEREILPQGSVANQWQAFEDRPLYWDAWDVDIFYDDKVYYAEPASSTTVVEHGPLRVTLAVQRRILNSSYTQRISLSCHSPRLDFETVIDWRERHMLLKAAFPVDLLSPVASYEVQWGHVQRPTHRNTSWDWARFETCAQKWVDLSEGLYGVALLNDSKYGHDIHDNVLRISLLRAPTHPDPDADQGEQRFTYSLYPHGTAAGLFEVAQRAYALNNPLLLRPANGGTIRPLNPLVSASGFAIIETVKQAKDGGGLIVRLYQSQRQREWVTLQVGVPLQSAYITNLLEENQAEVVVEHGEEDAVCALRLYLTPFQIVTLRLVLGTAEHGNG